MLPRGCSRSNIYRRIHKALNPPIPIIRIESTDEILRIDRDDASIAQDIPTNSASPCTLNDNSSDVSEIYVTDKNGSETFDESPERVIVTPNNTKVPAIVALRRASIKANITSAAIRIFLNEFRPLHPELPADPRTVLSTPRHTLRISIAGGHYVHFGLQDSIRNALRLKNIDNLNDVTLQIGIDGMTLFKRSSWQLWPILGKLIVPSSSVFIVGVYSGKCKPKNVHEFLNPTIVELMDGISNGWSFGSSCTLKIKLQGVICDAPARAFVKQMKQHSGYYACDRCYTRGTYDSGKVTFPELQADLRSDIEFRTRRQEEHHIGESPFEAVEVDMIRSFPLDYMHMVCLGVMKRLIFFWRCADAPANRRISPSSMRNVSARQNTLVSAITCDFPRKCRDWNEYEYWKATEFRQFLLYIGPVALKGILDENVYNNFLLLSISIYILCHPYFLQHYLPFVDSLIRRFVQQFCSLYGPSEMTYNMHCLIHLPNEAYSGGNLDCFSAFPFESYLGELRNMIHSRTIPESQLFRRIIERRKLDAIQDDVFIDDAQNLPIRRLPLRKKKIIQRGTAFTEDAPDNCIIVMDKPGFIVCITEQKILVRRFRCILNFFESPFPSSDIYIFQCEGLSEKYEWYSCKDIQCKCLALFCEGKTIVYPILHTVINSKIA